MHTTLASFFACIVQILIASEVLFCHLFGTLFGHMVHILIFAILGITLLSLEELDKALEGDVSVVVPHKHFCNLCWSHLYLPDQLFYLRVRVMVTDGVVVGGQDSERLGAAVPHVDVHVHPAWAKKRWIKSLLVVCCEDNDSLLPTC